MLYVYVVYYHVWPIFVGDVLTRFLFSRYDGTADFMVCYIFNILYHELWMFLWVLFCNSANNSYNIVIFCFCMHASSNTTIFYFFLSCCVRKYDTKTVQILRRVLMIMSMVLVKMTINICRAVRNSNESIEDAFSCSHKLRSKPISRIPSDSINHPVSIS